MSRTADARGGLVADGRYHFRVVASSASGDRATADKPFHTVDPFAGVKIASQTASAHPASRTARVAVSCPAGTPGRCKGTLRLRNHKLGAVGKGSFSIRAGRTAKVKVKLNEKALERLADRGKLSTSAKASARDGLGTRARSHGAVTLRLASQ